MKTKLTRERVRERERVKVNDDDEWRSSATENKTLRFTLSPGISTVAEFVSFLNGGRWGGCYYF